MPMKTEVQYLKATQRLSVEDVEALDTLISDAFNSARPGIHPGHWLAVGHLLDRMRELPAGSKVLLTARVTTEEENSEWDNYHGQRINVMRVNNAKS